MGIAVCVRRRPDRADPTTELGRGVEADDPAAGDWQRPVLRPPVRLTGSVESVTVDDEIAAGALRRDPTLGQERFAPKPPGRSGLTEWEPATSVHHRAMRRAG
ncbi:hypothetical protein GCM10023170_043500 [Phytohabitans houttuyneae]|uniref:Uncharacterized protein n=1 Tax=Phytohabitans houttuyneae TaxID=1076126 RepID=A0A6V8K8S9_9ACTN|nr:hypothetical protein Phou_040700 [Phytohabitans houttuyneae]